MIADTADEYCSDEACREKRFAVLLLSVFCGAATLPSLEFHDVRGRLFRIAPRE